MLAPGPHIVQQPTEEVTSRHRELEEAARARSGGEQAGVAPERDRLPERPTGKPRACASSSFRFRMFIRTIFVTKKLTLMQNKAQNLCTSKIYKHLKHNIVYIFFFFFLNSHRFYF